MAPRQALRHQARRGAGNTQLRALIVNHLSSVETCAAIHTKPGGVNARLELLEIENPEKPRRRNDDNRSTLVHRISPSFRSRADPGLDYKLHPVSIV